MTASQERLARAAVRIAALAALLVIGVVSWLGLVADPPMGAGVAYAITAACVAGALLAADRWPLRRRVVALVVAAIALAGGALNAAGIPLALLDPRDWDVLAAGMGDGIAALPGVTVPYRGVNEWVRVAIASGGCLLAGFAALATGWPRAGGRTGARGWALVAVAVLFTVPGIQLTADQPWLLGALFALALVVYVLAERLPVRLGAVAGGTVLATLLAGMLVAPAIDGTEPVVDVQKIASALQPEQPDRFSWTHGYGPLDWPRDGRELMRVRARRPSYWKAQDLELFDGVRWSPQPSPRRLVPIAEGLSEHPSWRQQLRVTIKGMQTRQFVAPGQTLSISRAPRQPVNTRPGGFSVAEGQDDLDEGSAYLAEAYVPRPSAAVLRASPVSYPIYLDDDLEMLTPEDGSTPRTLIQFPQFASDTPPFAAGPGVGSWQAQAMLERSGYGEVYALAQRLAAQSPTPYDFARRVERYLNSDEFTYDEQAADRPLPIPAFLLRDHAGYCQHFSGAMALLLRMGGVPARVVGGFSAGQFVRERREYVVRDLDAHSWVEVWFSGIGWVTFDPTPSEAPARSQAAQSGLTDPGVVPGGPQPSGAVRGGADLGPGGVAASLDAGDDSSPLIALAALLGAGGAALGGWGLWRRRDRLRRRRAQGLDEPELDELERALRRTGRPLAAGTTLLQLESRYAHSPGLRAYVRAIAERRYGGRGTGPTAAERRALRRDLAGGLGIAGRLRALWAVPPRPRLH
jgi:transglutaminase-like putative cysteine protease